MFPSQSALMKFRDEIVGMMFKESEKHLALHKRDPSKVMLLGRRKKPFMSFACFMTKFSHRFGGADYRKMRCLSARLLSLFPGSSFGWHHNCDSKRTIVPFYLPFELIPPRMPAAISFTRNRVERSKVYCSGTKYSCIVAHLRNKKEGLEMVVAYEFDTLPMD